MKKVLNFFSAALPITFIWSTPFLSKVGVCRLDYDKLLGHSLSRYISTPQATGMMAVAFFSISNIMISKRYLKAFEFKKKEIISPDYQLLTEEESCWKLNLFQISGYVYEIFFGVFLSAPCIWAPTIHGISVSIFSISAYVHMLLLQFCPELQQKWKYTLIFLNTSGTTAIIGMSVSRVIILYNIRLPNHLFWAFECTGLSSFILFMYVAQLALPHKTFDSSQEQ